MYYVTVWRRFGTSMCKQGNVCWQPSITLRTSLDLNGPRNPFDKISFPLQFPLISRSHPLTVHNQRINLIHIMKRSNQKTQNARDPCELIKMMDCKISARRALSEPEALGSTGNSLWYLCALKAFASSTRFRNSRTLVPKSITNGIQCRRSSYWCTGNSKGESKDAYFLIIEERPQELWTSPIVFKTEQSNKSKSGN